MNDADTIMHQVLQRHLEAGSTVQIFYDPATQQWRIGYRQQTAEQWLLEWGVLLA